MLGGDTEGRCLVPIDFDVELGIIKLDIAGDVLEFGDGPQPGFKQGAVAIQLLGIGALQGELVEGPADPAADIDDRGVDEEHSDSRGLGQLGPQLLDDFVRIQFPFAAGLKADEHASGVAGQVRAAGAYRGIIGLHVRVFADDLGQGLLMADHLLKGNALIGLGGG